MVGIFHIYIYRYSLINPKRWPYNFPGSASAQEHRQAAKDGQTQGLFRSQETPDWGGFFREPSGKLTVCYEILWVFMVILFDYDDVMGFYCDLMGFTLW